MINIPARYANLLKKDEVPKELVIHFPNGEHTDLTNEDIIAESMKFVESAGDTDTIKFGISDTPYIELDVVGVPDLSNSDIEVKLICDFSAYGGDDDYEINIGKFKISKMQINYNSDVVHILAYSTAMIDLSAEDITQSFFYDQYNAKWRGSLERLIDRYMDGYLSDTYYATDEYTMDKELENDTVTKTFKNYKSVYSGSGLYTFYWIKGEYTVRRCNYTIDTPAISEGSEWFYRFYEEWQSEGNNGYGMFGDDQHLEDISSWQNQIGSNYPYIPFGRDVSWDRMSLSRYYSDDSSGELTSRYYMLITPNGYQDYSWARASHCLSYKFYIGTSTNYVETNPPEPSSWTLIADTTYPEITIDAFEDIHTRFFIQKSYFFGVAINLDTSTNIRNAMAVNYPQNSTGFTEQVFWDMIAEILGKMCRMNRADGSMELYTLAEAESIYPSDDIFPSDEIFPQESNSYDINLSMYEFLNYQGDRSKKIGKVVIGSSGQYTAQVEDYSESEYESITISPDNIFVKAVEYSYGTSSNQLKGFADAILDNYKNYEFIPYECTAIGLPFMQAGDFIVVEDINHDRKKFYIARRTLSGIQALKDDYSAGGLS